MKTFVYAGRGVTLGYLTASFLLESKALFAMKEIVTSTNDYVTTALKNADSTIPAPPACTDDQFFRINQRLYDVEQNCASPRNPWAQTLIHI